MSTEGETRAGRFEADTLRWALGDVRACACPECWEVRELWRWVRILLGAVERERPGASPRELADALWSALAARGRGPFRRSGDREAAARALREHAALQGWNPGQLYEIVLRGVARNR